MNSILSSSNLMALSEKMINNIFEKVYVQWILSHKNKIVLIIVMGISLFYLFSRFNYGLNLYDDGILIYGGLRVFEGSIPYRDFWFVYPPGNLYVVAGLFKIFGPSILIERIFNSIVSFLIIIFTYLLTRKIVSKEFIFVFTIIIATFWVGLNQYYANMNLAILFSLICSFYYVDYIKNNQNSYLVLTGIFTGLSALFRLDVGIYIFLSVTLTLITFEGFTHLKLDLILKENLVNVFKKWLIFLGGTLIILLPPIIYFLYFVPINELISLFVVFPAKIYPAYRNLPFPSLELDTFFPFYLAITTFIMTSIWVVYNRKKNIKSEIWIIAFFIILGSTFMDIAGVRTDYVHLYSAMIIVIILISFLFSKIDFNFKKSKSKSAVNIFVIYLLVMISMQFAFFSTSIIYSDNGWVPLKDQRGSGIYIESSQADIIPTLNYIQNNIPLNDKIFVGSSHHDQITINNVILYFLAGHPSSTKYHELHPGIVTTLPVQNEIINELKNNVKYIILWNGMDYYREPNKSNETSSVTALDDFIKSNYKVIKIIGNYTIYKKIDSNREVLQNN